MQFKALAEKYNLNDSVIFITSFPARQNRSIQNLNAVASYSDHLISRFSKLLESKGMKVIILSEILDEEEVYEEGNVLVVRCWRRNKLPWILDIADAVGKFNKVNKIVVQFEFNMFGGIIATSLLPLLLCGLRLAGKSTILVMHQVVDDLNSLKGHLDGDSIKISVFNPLLKLFNLTISAIANKLIVHEEVLKARLPQFVRNKIAVISHGVGEYKKGEYEVGSEKKNLGFGEDDFIILCFGFITWYKGSDAIVKSFVEYIKTNPNTNLRLVMAGGESANLKNKPHYQEFYKSVMAAALSCSRITVTGFVSDSDVPSYFKCADLVVLPYRAQMSGSGPLAVAFSFGKPFLLSQKLSGAILNPDFKEELENSGLNAEDLIFDISNNSLFSMIDKLKEDRLYVSKLAKLSESLGNRRSWGAVSEKYLEVIDA